ncbi:glycosyltransferase [Streptomyces sp. DG2A-72]|uniref:glycosyltransferase family 2 protein n=1 Tax=Streptomyces sp. DG2A-72 TaxID=3051386 RepID=UPI00265B978B|nr:glycosyltransferase [Streptomyces sp. DG2A-72]MDO0936577.1 glycosyltransferase [Streptomyces sp. DG2A-72]
MTLGADLPLTIAICSNRPDSLPGAVVRTAAAMGARDRLLIIADMPAQHVPTLPTSASPPPSRIRVICNAGNQGLAHSRNKAMKEATTRHLVFLDDDIVPTVEALTQIRAALTAGAQVTGTRISAHLQGHRRPWFLTSGQLHYLGSHAPSRPASIWGGSFAIDSEHARLLGVGFDERLGRIGSSLTSAEDTTFVREMIARGATATILHDAEVQHLIPAHRLTLSYLLRRAFWQGRSEARRDDARRGIGKEWNRNRSGDGARPVLTALALFYTSSVLLGVCWEAITRSRASATDAETGSDR